MSNHIYIYIYICCSNLIYLNLLFLLCYNHIRKRNKIADIENRTEQFKIWEYMFYFEHISPCIHYYML